MTLILVWLHALACGLSPATALGDSLLRHGFHAEAGHEFRRSLFRSDPQDSGSGLIRLKLGLGLGAGHRLTAAARELREAGRLNQALATPAQLALAGFYAHQDRHDLAELELSDLLVFTSDSSRRASLRSALAWLRLRQGDLSAAAASYEQAGATDFASSIRSFGQGPRRSPTLAAALSSLVPGSGEFYVARPRTGLFALLITAGSALWAYSAARNEDWVSASVIVSTFFWRFYNGSRANAIALAEEYNLRARQRQAEKALALVCEPTWFGEAESLLGYRLRLDSADLDSLVGPR